VLSSQGSIFQAEISRIIGQGDQGADLQGYPCKKRKIMEIGTALFETLKHLCSVLNKAQSAYCLIGGLAVGILAKPRATEDIDLLMLMGEDSVESLRKLLRHHFDVIQDHDIMHFRNCTIWRIVVSDSFPEDNGLVIVDIVFADREVYKNALADTICLEIDDTVIPVVRPEHLIEIKRLSGRPVDLLDIQALQDAEKMMD